MENTTFIPANQLPEAEGDEVSVMCLEGGELKQKPAKGLGGGGGHWVMYRDGNITASEGIYEAIADFFANGVPVSVTTFRVENGDNPQINSGLCNYIYVNPNPEGDELVMSGVDGITFYIRKNGNHDYYWD